MACNGTALLYTDSVASYGDDVKVFTRKKVTAVLLRTDYDGIDMLLWPRRKKFIEKIGGETCTKRVIFKTVARMGEYIKR
jgi:hypothetical protein